MRDPLALERLWAKVDVGVCWLWTAALDRDGYGQFWFEGRVRAAHRFVYALLVGPIPANRPLLDHHCRVRACVNPDHLEPVTVRENTRRGYGVTARHLRRAVTA